MGDKKDNSFDVKFTLLSPELVVKMWTLGLDADTSKVNIAYQEGAFTTNLNYDYGGNVSAGLAFRRNTSSVSIQVEPAAGKIDLGLVYRGFNFSASDNIQKSSMSFGVGYGMTLLPFPDELESSFRAAGAGIGRMAGDLGSAGNNPLRYYNLHSNDVTAISNAVRMGQSIYSAGNKSDSGKKSDTFGAGLRLNYTPQSGLVIYGAVGLEF